MIRYALNDAARWKRAMRVEDTIISGARSVGDQDTVLRATIRRDDWRERRRAAIREALALRAFRRR